MQGAQCPGKLTAPQTAVPTKKNALNYCAEYLVWLIGSSIGCMVGVGTITIDYYRNYNIIVVLSHLSTAHPQRINCKHVKQRLNLRVVKTRNRVIERNSSQKSTQGSIIELYNPVATGFVKLRSTGSHFRTHKFDMPPTKSISDHVLLLSQAIDD